VDRLQALVDGALVVAHSKVRAARAGREGAPLSHTSDDCIRGDSKVRAAWAGPRPGLGYVSLGARSSSPSVRMCKCACHYRSYHPPADHILHSARVPLRRNSCMARA
jgi:hypothetical protein